MLRGIYLLAPAADPEAPLRSQILASGVGVPWALRAQELLAQDWNVHADVWSVTSWNELRRDGLECDDHNLLHPQDEARIPYITQKLAGAPGPIVAVSDYMKAVQDQISPWVQQPWSSLGTDGWGLSDTRGALRRHFLVDAESITVQTLAELAVEGRFPREDVDRAIQRYQLNNPAAADAGNTEGGG